MKPDESMGQGQKAEKRTASTSCREPIDTSVSIHVLDTGDRLWMVLGVCATVNALRSVAVCELLPCT